MCLKITRFWTCWHTEIKDIRYCIYLNEARRLLDKEHVPIDDPRIEELDRKCGRNFSETIEPEYTICEPCRVERGPGVRWRWGWLDEDGDKEDCDKKDMCRKKRRAEYGSRDSRIRGNESREDKRLENGTGENNSRPTVQERGAGNEWVMAMRSLDGQNLAQGEYYHERETGKEWVLAVRPLGGQDFIQGEEEIL